MNVVLTVVDVEGCTVATTPDPSPNSMSEFREARQERKRIMYESSAASLFAGHARERTTFTLQFKPASLTCGTSRDYYGDYTIWFAEGRYIAHMSELRFKTESEAIAYGNAILDRYRNLALAAFTMFMESQDV